MEKILFEEKQKFNQIWIWGLFLTILVILFYPFYLGKFYEIQNYLSIGILLFIMLLLGFTKLETKITDKGIYYRYYPIQSEFREILWEEIAEAYTREYRPLIDFGGWGYRIGLFGKGKAISTSGNQGIQLYMKDHRKILLGTQKPEIVQKILENLGYGKKADI